MIEGQHFQNGYVTNDVEAAVQRFLACADVRKHKINNMDGEVLVGGKPTPLKAKMAFIWVNDLLYELIEPLAPFELYSPHVPEDGSLHFHHAAMRINDWKEFYPRLLAQPYPIMMEGRFGELRSATIDTRPLLGHFLEFAYYPENAWTGMGGR